MHLKLLNKGFCVANQGGRVCDGWSDRNLLLIRPKATYFRKITTATHEISNN